MLEELPKLILLEDLGYLYSKEGNKEKTRFGIYRCGFCGTKFKTRVSCVNSGHTKSCGCYKIQRASETKKTHGLAGHRLYGIWGNIKARVLNPKHKRYNDYGGRGITICEEWLDIQNFYDWAMLNGYSDELSLDRIDNDGNYEPNNCRWTTPNIQARNQRISSKNTSGYKGVSYRKDNNKYRAVIVINKKTINLGHFLTPLEAALAYNNYIIENNLEGFILNEIPDKNSTND